MLRLISCGAAACLSAIGSVQLDLEVLIDTSSSMRPRLEVAKTVASHFLGTLRPKDQGSIVAFTRDLNVVQPPTSDVARLRAALQPLVARGTTSLYTSLDISVHDLASRAARRKDARRSAVKVLTDGEDTSSLTSDDDLLDEARRSNVAAYPIAISDSFQGWAATDEGGHRFLDPSDDALRRLAAETGARAFFPCKLADLAGVYDQTAHELETQYSLAYARASGADDSTFHRLSVRLISRAGAPGRCAQPPLVLK